MASSLKEQADEAASAETARLEAKEAEVKKASKDASKDEVSVCCTSRTE